MAKKVWVVKWYKPSRFDPRDKILEWHTFFSEDEAKAYYEEVKTTNKEAIDLRTEETECCSL